MAAPQPSRPAKTSYGVRVRNTSADPRGAWATFAKSAREAAGLSQSEMARRLSTDRTTIWRWENSRQRVESADMVAAFAALTGVDLDEALAAAGLVPNVAPPTEPTREPDEERDLIMASQVSPPMKAVMLQRLEELRRQDEARIEDLRRVDKQRRMEMIRVLLGQDS